MTTSHDLLAATGLSNTGSATYQTVATASATTSITGGSTLRIALGRFSTTTVLPYTGLAADTVEAS
jgi:hypothetical protein